jgi:hypothetical protein
MQATDPSTAQETGGPSRRASLAMAGQVLLTLVMLAGASVWLVATHAGGSGRAASMQPQAAVAARAAAATQPPAAFTYYLVDSQGQAATVQDGLQHLVAGPDLNQGPYEVAVANSPQASAQFQEAVAQADAQRLALRVVDLRAQTTGSASGGDSNCAGLLPDHC